MAIRIEIYVDDEMVDEVEFDSRVEAEEAKVGGVILDKIPYSDEEVDAMTPEEKKAYLDRLMEETEES